MIPSAHHQPNPKSLYKLRLTVNQRELSFRTRNVRVTIQNTRNTVCSPPSMRHRSLRNKSLVHVDFGTSLNVGMIVPIGTIPIKFGRQGSRITLRNVFTECSNFTNFFEEDNGGFGSIAVDSDTCLSALTLWKGRERAHTS